ncbi:hypothetical protein Lfu02_61980 [Longispora fulva]|uniref:Uncharacterized protein n=1 Tax=Longispora fulva TaxID=619741 RepID=A0A8J7GA88_9ACTN|nr:hypothetical protein [Longispora fulva]MBG6134619.1 hypothetical protein [Longispora fulva]GIG61826.1 hypothetical protein Lfu02_61980 [Longispora fulva]
MGEYYSSAARVSEPRVAAHRASTPMFSDPHPPRRFALRRWQDDTGVSGLGIVAYGVAWPDDKVVMRWLGTTTGVAQVCVFDSLDDLMRIHGHGGRSEIVWVDPYTVASSGEVRVGGYID